MRSLANGDNHNASLLQFSNQLAYLARHTTEAATLNRHLPASIHRQGHAAQQGGIRTQADAAPVFDFHLGENTPERKDHGMGHLVVPVEE